MRAYKGEDPLYFTAKALGILLLLRYGNPDELYQYAIIAAKHVRNTSDGHRARAYYDLAVKLARWAKNENEARETLKAIAETWVGDAEDREGIGNFLAAREFWEEAVQTFEAHLTNNLVFALRSMLTEENGPNLRNLLLHGLLPPSACKSYTGVFVWWLVLRLVVFYTPRMQEFVVRRQERAEAGQN